MICVTMLSTPSVTRRSFSWSTKRRREEGLATRRGSAPVQTVPRSRQNAQVAVYLTYAAPRGHALMSRACTCRAAGRRIYAAPALESRMSSGVRDQTLTGCDTDRPRCGRQGSRSVGGRRRSLWHRPAVASTGRGHGLGYVMAIAVNRRVPTHAGPFRVDALPALTRHAWQKHSAGAGSHGPRLYSWAWFRLLAEDDTDTGFHQLLIRRNEATGEHAYLRCYSPAACHHCAPWSRWLVSAGASRNRSKPPKAWSGWTSTRSAARPPGTARPPWRCSPTPSWPWPPPPSATPAPTPTGLIALTVDDSSTPCY